MNNSYAFLAPYPQKLRASRRSAPRPACVAVRAPREAAATAALLRADLRALASIKVARAAPFVIDLSCAGRRMRPESYRLQVRRDGASIVAGDPAGLYYGTQTLLQLLVLGKPAEWRELLIEDWPHYKLRSFMVDLGRAPYSLPLLRRVVRILARLKMNLLHLHLTDDQLNGLRFRRLPLGRENPHAMTLSQLGALVRYARRYHVAIMPEIECWGHAASILHHYPELHGGPGMWGGKSFGLGPETFDLFEKIFDELVPVLERKCLVHVGLDEAIWATLKSVPPSRRADFSPATLVGRLHAILERAGRKHGREVTMHLWADHGGRPIPPALTDKVVVEPWMYFEARADDIKDKVRRYGGRGKTRFMLGGGMSSMHFSGHFGATRVWCQAARRCPNVEGVTICLWEGNDVAGHMLGLYGGADFAWSPATPVRQTRRADATTEFFQGEVGQRMRRWQRLFPDADHEAINCDRGPEVEAGCYCWGARAGQPVAPSVLARDAPVADDDTKA